MSIPCRECGHRPLSARAIFTLEALGCATREDLAAYYVTNPLRVKGCGQNTFWELIDWLEERDLKFSPIGP